MAGGEDDGKPGGETGEKKSEGIWCAFRETLGMLCFGFFVCVIIILLLLRLQDWTAATIDLIIVAIGGYSTKFFNLSDKENVLFYPVGLVAAMIVCGLILISPYSIYLLRFIPVQTNLSVTTSPTVVPTIAMGNQSITLAPTLIPTLTPISSSPYHFEPGQFLPISWIILFIIIGAMACLIAYWIFKTKKIQ